eukprot:7000637-Pyramimonas_sp.AAC.1
MEYGLGELTMDGRQIPPPRHRTSCLGKHPQDRDYSRLRRPVPERQTTAKDHNVRRHSTVQAPTCISPNKILTPQFNHTSSSTTRMRRSS